MTEEERKTFKEIDPKKLQIDVNELKMKTQMIVAKSTEKMKKYRI